MHMYMKGMEAGGGEKEERIKGTRDGGGRREGRKRQTGSYHDLVDGQKSCSSLVTCKYDIIFLKMKN